MNVLPRKPVLSHREGIPDNLIIFANSFEKRCCGLVEQLELQRQKYLAESVVLIRYGDRSDTEVGRRAATNAKMLEAKSRRISIRNELEPLELEPYDLLEARAAFTMLFASLPVGSAVLADISTLTKPHVIYLLQAAYESSRINHLRLAYTRARYGRYDAMSWGAEEPLILPGFGRTRSLSDKGTYLAMFCGLEPERCYSIWRRFGHGGGERLFIDSGPDDLDRCAHRAMRYNNLLVDMPAKVLRAFCPNETLSQLNRIYSTAQKSNKHLFIAPLTTKWEAVALWKFFQEQPKGVDASIVYAAPGRFNVLGYTREIWGEILICDLNMTEIRRRDNVPLAQ